LSLGSAQYLILIYGAAEIATFMLCAIFFALALVPIAVTRLTQPPQIVVPKLIVRRLMKISPVGVAGSVGTGLGNGAFWGLGALYGHDLGYTDTEIAMFMSAVIFGGALLQVPIGHQSDKHDRRKVLMIVSFLTVLSALLIYILASRSWWGMLVGAVLYGGFSFAVYSLMVAHTNDHIEPEEVTDATRGLLLLNGLGAAIGPIVAGILMQQFGPQSLILYFAAVFALLGFYTLHRMSVSKPLPMDQQGEFVAFTRTGTAAVEMDPRTEHEEDEGESQETGSQTDTQQDINAEENEPEQQVRQQSQ
jgi:MFS family permease